MAGFSHTITALGRPSRRAGDAHWQTLAVFNIFRLLTVIALVAGGFLLSFPGFFLKQNFLVFLYSAACYSVMALLFSWRIARRKPLFDTQLAIHVTADVAFIVSLMFLAGGMKSGLGLLLLPYLAAAGLIAKGRMTLFHAALATVALLIEETDRVLSEDISDYNYTTLALLCIACFAVAWLAHRLAHYAQESQKLAEQRRVDLAKLDQLNQRILEDVSDGVLVVDGRGLIRQFNPQTERLIGSLPQAGGGLRDLLPDLAKALEQWREDPLLPASMVQAQRSRKVLRPRFVSLKSGFEGAVLIYLEDMDRLRRESQQIKLVALGRLTANLAHEIRNPLGAISHASQLLQEEAKDPLSQKLTRIIADNTARLEHMVREVLELNRRDRVQRSDIVLPDWLRTFLDEFSQMEKIAVALPLVCPQDATIRFDPSHLHQVLWNLVRNGWRYCRKQDASLVLRVSKQSGNWQLDVINDGPAVSPEVQAQLFEPFFTTDAKGTGLGLYIAREICQANEAALEYVASSDEGACFRIIFGVSDGQKIH